MNLSDLRVFVAVARHQSLAAASEQLHLTPSAISKALRRLEDSLGGALFDRSNRQLVLNQGGARLLDRAQVLLALAEQARADLRGGASATDSPKCGTGLPHRRTRRTAVA
jgi:DNA-binding transcriptional LysR family regulator